MKAVATVVLAFLVWLAWELAGGVVAELLAPILRPFKFLAKPPLGAFSLLVVWGSAAVLAGYGFREPTGPFGVVAFVVAAFGLILTLVVRDECREAKGLPAVRTRFPAQFSIIQRIGLALVAFAGAGTSALVFLLIGPTKPETWLTAAGGALILVWFGGAAWRGRFSESAASLLGGGSGEK